MLSRDLTNPRWMYLKAALFVCLGLMAAGLIIVENPNLRTVGLLALTVWAFCRAYYFAFYVIQHYVDDEYHFSGLGSAAAWFLRRSDNKRDPEEGS